MNVFGDMQWSTITSFLGLYLSIYHIAKKKILQVKISGYTASTPRLLYIILWKTSIIAHLDKFISSTSDKVLSMYIHSVDGLSLTPVQLSDLWSIVCLPVANLPVCTSSDDLAFIRSIAHRTEHRVGKYHLTTNKTPVERESKLRISEISTILWFFADLLQIPDNTCSISTSSDTLGGNRNTYKSDTRFHIISNSSLPYDWKWAI